jgi:hypothetical protein
MGIREFDWPVFPKQFHRNIDQCVTAQQIIYYLEVYVHTKHNVNLHTSMCVSLACFLHIDY